LPFLVRFCYKLVITQLKIINSQQFLKVIVINQKFMIKIVAMYILKIKGKAKIPDYIQLRDENFTLKAYFRVDRPEKSLIKFGYDDIQLEKLMQIIKDIPFGKVMKLEL
jgi:hypothetical protein